MRILIRYKEKVALKTIEKKACFLQTKKAWRLNLSNRGTGIPYHDQVSPRPGREHLHLSSCGLLKITSFLFKTQSECF